MLCIFQYLLHVIYSLKKAMLCKKIYIHLILTNLDNILGKVLNCSLFLIIHQQCFRYWLQDKDSFGKLQNCFLFLFYETFMWQPSVPESSWVWWKVWKNLLHYLCLIFSFFFFRFCYFLAFKNSGKNVLDKNHCEIGSYCTKY